MHRKNVHSNNVFLARFFSYFNWYYNNNNNNNNYSNVFLAFLFL